MLNVDKKVDFDVNLIIAKGINNSKAYPEITELLRDAEDWVKLTMGKRAEVSVDDAAKQSGVHAHDTPLKALIINMEKGKRFHKDGISDLCNFISVKYLVPIFVFDLKRIRLPIKVKTDMSIHDSVSVLFSNGKMNKKTIVTKDTTSIAVVVAAEHKVSEELKMLLKDFFQAKISTSVPTA